LEKFSPEQISAFILKKIKDDAEKYIGEPISKAVITVPAYFNDNQRQATKDAGEIAGFEVLRVLNEPTAAALAYGLIKSDEKLKILVFDLGGGTLDVTIMDINEGKFEVKSTSGDTELGGIDMDTLLVDYIVCEFNKKNTIDIRKDKRAMARIKEEAEKAKIELTNVEFTEIVLPFITYTQEHGPVDFSLSLPRYKLEELISPLLEKCKTPIANSLKDSQLTIDDI